MLLPYRVFSIAICLHIEPLQYLNDRLPYFKVKGQMCFKCCMKIVTSNSRFVKVKRLGIIYSCQWECK